MQRSIKNIFRYLFPPLIGKRTISAVHEVNLEKLLEKFDLLKKVTDGELTCHFCNDKIEIKNIESVFSYEGDIKLCCDKITCYMQLSEIIHNGNR